MNIAATLSYIGSYSPSIIELSYHLVQVKSVLDPCEDENDDIQNDEVSLGADSVERDEDSESDNEVICQYYV